MSEPFSRPVILDATVLSNYASTDSVTWLATILDDLQTVPAVRTELEQGREVGYAYLEQHSTSSNQVRLGLLRPHRGNSSKTIRQFRTGLIPAKPKLSWLQIQPAGRS